MLVELLIIAIVPGLNVIGAPITNHVAIKVVALRADATVGQELIISCTTDSPTDALWSYKSKTGESQTLLVFNNEVLASNYTKRLHLSNEHNQSIIKISEVRLSDAGVYICYRSIKHFMEREETTVAVEIPGTFCNVAMAEPGETATLPCNSSEQDISWVRYESMNVPVWIYSENEIRPVFRTSGRYSVSKDFHLSITNVSFDDSGFYACVERNGLGDQHFVKLVISNEKYTTTIATTVAFHVGDETSTSDIAKVNEIHDCTANVAVSVVVTLITYSLALIIVVCVRRRRAELRKPIEKVGHDAGNKPQALNERTELTTQHDAFTQQEDELQRTHAENIPALRMNLREKYHLSTGKVMQLEKILRKTSENEVITEGNAELQTLSSNEVM